MMWRPRHSPDEEVPLLLSQVEEATAPCPSLAAAYAILCLEDLLVAFATQRDVAVRARQARFACRQARFACLRERPHAAAEEDALRRVARRVVTWEDEGDASGGGWRTRMRTWWRWRWSSPSRGTRASKPPQDIIVAAVSS